MNTSMYEFIENIIPKERIFFDEPMSRHTTFRIGGTAECMVLIEQEEELLKLVPYLNQIEEDYFILGNGSNLLVGDKGYRGHRAVEQRLRVRFFMLCAKIAHNALVAD